MAFQLEEATIDGIHEAMRAGDLTSAQLVEAYLERIEAIDRNGPRLNSVLGMNPNAAARAAELEAEAVVSLTHTRTVAAAVAQLR